MTVFNYLFNSLTQQQLKLPCLTDLKTSAKVTYQQFRDSCKSVGQFILGKYRLKRGDHVGVSLKNGIECSTVIMGCISVGLVPVPMNVTLTKQELIHQLTDSNCRAIVQHPEDDRADDSNFYGYVIKSDSLVYTLQCSHDIYSAEPSDVATICYSSGTTGLPKGVMLTHESMISNLKQMDARYPRSDRCNVLSVLPMYHIYALQCILNISFLRRQHVHVMERYNLQDMCKYINEYNLDILYFVPPILSDIVKHRPNVNLKRAFIVCGAAPITESLMTTFHIIHPSSQVVQLYGMTEGSPLFTLASPGDDPNSVGTLLDGTELKIICPSSGKTITEDDVEGELCFSGPQVMRGYWNNQAATEKTIIDGFIHTGDLGYMRDGMIYISGRSKELIKYKGYQVSPTELESKLMDHSGIIDCCVVGLTRGSDDTIHALVVSKLTDEELEDIRTQINKNVSHYKRIKFIHRVNEIVRTQSGKILRKAMIDLIPKHVGIIDIGTSVGKHKYRMHDFPDVYERLLNRSNNTQEAKTKALSLMRRLCGSSPVSPDIKYKYSCTDLEDDFIESIDEKNKIAREAMCDLMLSALGDISLEGVTHVISSTSTILGAPGPDAYFLDLLKLSPSVKRLSIQQMGCTGGGSLLDMAFQICRADPKHRVLAIAIDLCCPTFYSSRTDPNDVIISYLFGDGCSIALVGTDTEVKLKYSSSGCYTAPNTLRDMTIDVTPNSLTAQLSRSIDKQVLSCIDPLLNNVGYVQGDKLLWHPGGKTILQALDTRFERCDESWKVYSKYGNMAAPTLLFVLNEYLKSNRPRGENVVACCFGQGLYTEAIRMTRM
uniref:AMP-dependent synthetase/ligase domain-containing protein n=1 Tax=viral metagenome TaxID=1070528 RepID=A0A6C0BN60_9ZZZZ